MSWYSTQASQPSSTHQLLAQRRQQLLTKPAGSLGQLEHLAVQLSALQATERPSCERVNITIFAGDHGVTQENISAFPASVTAQMVQNFSTGGAAISVLAKSLNAQLNVINTGTLTKLPALKGVEDLRIAAGTANFAKQPAMTPEQLTRALSIGQNSVHQAQLQRCQLWIGGEMGIGNTSAATALACALLNVPAAQLVGPGTGLDNNGQRHKAAVIHNALTLHKAKHLTRQEQLQTFGGFEIAALTGSYIAAAQAGIPVLVDGFICSVAALYAMALNPSVKPWLLLSHQSKEPGHKTIVAEFEHNTLLQLDLCLGEASGAAITVPLLRLACALHNNMATFDQAGIDNREDR